MESNVWEEDAGMSSTTTHQESSEFTPVSK